MTHYAFKMINLMKNHASQADNMLGQMRYGRIETYDPEKHRCECSILPEVTDDHEKITTGWLHIVTAYAGPEYGDVTPYEPGTTVILQPMYNSDTEYVIVASFYHDEQKPAKGPDDIGGGDVVVQPGEKLIKSKSGFSVKWVNGNTLMLKGDNHKEEVLHIITKGTDVHITVSDFIKVDCDTAVVNANTSVTVTAPETTINGHLQVNGSINATGNITDYGASMGLMRELFDVHTHGDTPFPIPQMPE